jgi:hypothetical protein
MAQFWPDSCLIASNVVIWRAENIEDPSMDGCYLNYQYAVLGGVSLL